MITGKPVNSEHSHFILFEMPDVGDVEKIFLVVRQAHHERKRGNDINTATDHPELVEGLEGAFQQPLASFSTASITASIILPISQ